MLTPEGVYRAFGSRQPTALAKALRVVLSKRLAMRADDWRLLSGVNEEDLWTCMSKGWLYLLSYQSSSPEERLSTLLPRVIALLSGSQQAMLATEQGLCIASSGFAETEVEAVGAVAAEFFEFLQRRLLRGGDMGGHIMSCFSGVDALLPQTTFVPLWMHEVGYGLVLGGEPLINGLALVDLVWALQVADDRFSLKSGR